MELGREVGGYVLAGGQSSRMGREKALLELGGKTLIERAVTKLRRVCSQVAILSSNPALQEYAPLVADVHPGCGPLGGMEAALWQTSCEWNLFLPVDVPFLPTVYLKAWLGALSDAEAEGARVWIFTVEGVAQPTVALLHRHVRPFLTEALENGRYKLFPVLERAAAELEEREPKSPRLGLWKLPYRADVERWPGQRRVGEDWGVLTEGQRRAQAFWFANLNTPEDLAEAESHLDALGD